MREIHLLLTDIRSTHNVGSIFRTADGAGVKKIYLSSITPAPVDRFGRARADIAKVALGAEKSVAWESVRDVRVLIKEKKKEGFQIIAVEQDEKAIDYKKLKTKEKILIIMGEEVNGIGKDILHLCNKIIEIPMLGKKESLNVSVATGIVLYNLI